MLFSWQKMVWVTIQIYSVGVEKYLYTFVYAIASINLQMNVVLYVRWLAK